MFCMFSAHPTNSNLFADHAPLYRVHCCIFTHATTGLCPDWEDWDPKDNKENAAEVMKLADDWLGIPQVYSSLFTNRFALCCAVLHGFEVSNLSMLNSI